MTQKLIIEQEKELQEIIQLSKLAEDKLQKMSNFATKIVEKHEEWYVEAQKQAK